ncbi:hypothetical protein BTO06_13350 [Tenacibaculum sp. SZ-18]|uniref:hypothetical protein n=1 Tax=Tenacibaculum sp. SZ-18 TaxID=754423 RepID=UPI000C2D21B4|nr:hypothetical protein [Tenacibaculum sp. SZ-18]AUC16082.1 hypothetical protein BTO06_13350 [Tenacibaculum sp. SZ-18]
MFAKERGNLFGITLSLNYSYEKGEGSSNKLAAERFFARISTKLSRASTIYNFRSSVLDATGFLGNDVNGNPIEFSQSNNAFIGDSLYEYGFGSSFNFEMYYYPFKIPLGFFGSFTYHHIKFSKVGLLENLERLPMRLGMLFNLKGKKDSKPIVTIQAFVDRTDLNLEPNGDDKDLRFGLGFGLPINIR